MKSMRIIFLAVALLGIHTYTSAQSKYYSKVELLSDLDSLYQSIDEIHPDMFEYSDKDRWMQQFQNTKDILPDSMDAVSFYRLIAPLMTSLNDGHTGTYLPYELLSGDQKIYFPFEVQIDKHDHSLVVGRIYFPQKYTICEGSKIEEINGHKANEIVSRLLEFNCGEKTPYKIAKINKDFDCNFYFAFNEGESMLNVKYSYGGVVDRESIQALSSRELKENDSLFKKKGLPYYSYHKDTETNTAIVEFNSFSDLDKFKIFLDSIFQDIKANRIENLVVDIRKNSGGNTQLGDEFFQYISPIPFQQYSKITAKVSNRMKTFFEMGMDDVPNGVGEYVFGSEDMNELRENPLRFTGNVYLLTSNYTFSAAADFSWAFQQFGMGTVIGEETGGNAVCYGDNIHQKLPHTQLPYRVSFQKFYSFGASDENTHGTIPDYEVPAAQAMDMAMGLIR